jgi:hypothetical protein
MDFNFNEHYVIELDSDNIASLQMNLDNVLSKVSTLNISDKTQIEYITGEKSQRDDENSEMYHDSWTISIFCGNERSRFVKNIGDSATYICAKNIHTQNYEEFTMDVSDAVEVLRDLAASLTPSPVKTDSARPR